LSSYNFVKCIIEQNRVRSSSLCSYTLEDSYKIYFTIFGHFCKFLGVFEVWNNFCGLNKWETKFKSALCWASNRPGATARTTRWPPTRGGREAERALAWRRMRPAVRPQHAAHALSAPSIAVTAPSTPALARSSVGTRRARCSAPDGESTGERWQLRRAIFHGPRLTRVLGRR
jgi:hypothetical protein